MFKVFLTSSYSNIVKRIILDTKLKEQSKIDLFLNSIFGGFGIILTSASMGEGKGTTSASILTYAKGDNPQKKIYTKRKIYGILPCPDLPFLDGRVLNLSSVPNGSIAYIPELAIVYGNTSKDYGSEEGSNLSKDAPLIRQKDLIIYGELQND